MAKNKNNNFRNNASGSSKNNTSSSSKNSTSNVNHSGAPDKSSGSRSGPGGE